jgi:16S rRNA G966 N2-methylase RsmD
VLVDSGREAQALATENAAALGFAAQVELLPIPVERGIAKLHARGARFDLIFADPPYAHNALEQLLAQLSIYPLLEPGGRLVIEHSKHEKAPASSGLFTQADQRIFGETTVTIFVLT